MIILIAVILVFSFAPKEFFDEMETLKEGTQEGTASDRIYLWNFCFEMFYDYPVFGVGPTNYPYYFSDYELGQRYPMGALRPPHSTPLQWMAEMGIFGILVLLYFQIALFKNWLLYRKYKFEINNLKPKGDFSILPLITHANAFSQTGFWFGAIFLSLMPYPFYWILIPFSEAWKNIYDNFIEENKNEF